MKRSKENGRQMALAGVHRVLLYWIFDGGSDQLSDSVAIDGVPPALVGVADRILVALCGWMRVCYYGFMCRAGTDRRH